MNKEQRFIVGEIAVITRLGVLEAIDRLGAIPHFIRESDERDVIDQIDDRYKHGGGWINMTVGKGGWELHEGNSLKFPGDPKISPFAWTQFRGDRICFYDHAVVAVIRKDGSFRVARID